eukprot:TRINITY_DN4100_c0_g1_i5.p1 TRINITY_DN4100_c0_g1~~TRINITY_DN4100_c0_g1_i5.p1  ORF type:complete len:517 (-),score=80.92 TRINITY_DN4100_c0_g1_i5:214-1764(-)
MGRPISDVQVCDGIVAAVAYNEDSDALDGSLLIFSPYDATTKKIEKLNEIDICSEPDHLVFTPDCSKILVACSGKPGLDAKGNYINPEGAVAIIDTKNIATATSKAVTIADFTSFNKDADDYVEAGVRYVYTGQVSPKGAPKDTFSKDMEPEYIATSLDGTIGYIVLQTNNALAYLDIDAGEITDIKSFGYKEWGAQGLALDASDQDGEISLRQYNIRGLYMPDIIDVFVHDGDEYIVSANEGDAKELTMEDNGVIEYWTEEITGSDLVSVIDDAGLQMALNDSTLLGSLTFSSVDGAPSGGVDTALYTYGGRSVSIWTADTLELIWDSGDLLETEHEDKYPSIFNMDASGEFCPLPKNYPQYGSTQSEIIATIREEIETNQTADPDYLVPREFDALVSGPTDGFDKRSDNKGPEPESVAVGMIGDKRILVVGNERTSTIFLFDITDPLDVSLEGSIYDGAIAGNWWDQLVAETVAPIDPEGLLFIGAENFPTKDSIVMISSALASSVHLYKVIEN